MLLVQSRPQLRVSLSDESVVAIRTTQRVGGQREGQGRAVDLTTVLQESDIQPSAQESIATNLFPVRREELFSYDVLIIGDADPSFFTNTSLQDVSDFVTERGGGVIFIAGPRYMPHAYRDTQLANLVSLRCNDQPATSCRVAAN